MLDFEKELKFILSKEIFYKKPSEKRVILYAILYLVLSAIAVTTNLYFLVSIFTLPLLIYVLAAKGKQHFIPVSILSLINTYFLGTYTALSWIAVHILIAYIIYSAIRYRYSKILVLMYISSFIFFVLGIYLSILIKLNVITYSPMDIQAYIDSYVSSVVNIDASINVDILRQSFEQLKRYFPTLIFAAIVLYVLILINYTFSFLSRERAIVPIFPKLKLMGLSKQFASVYLTTTLILVLVSLSISDPYNPYLLFFDNIYTIISWMFVFNGICTVFYFIEANRKSSGIFLKIITLISAYMFSAIFDIIGLADALLRIREYYARSKGGQ